MVLSSKIHLFRWLYLRVALLVHITLMKKLFCSCMLSPSPFKKLYYLRSVVNCELSSSRLNVRLQIWTEVITAFKTVKLVFFQKPPKASNCKLMMHKVWNIITRKIRMVRTVKDFCVCQQPTSIVHTVIKKCVTVTQLHRVRKKTAPLNMSK